MVYITFVIIAGVPGFPPEEIKMPNTSNFKALISEWRLVINALESYKDVLDSRVKNIEDDDLKNEIYDDLERLERLIPDFQSQFENEYSQP